jgi:hypothetical protein
LARPFVGALSASRPAGIGSRDDAETGGLLRCYQPPRRVASRASNSLLLYAKAVRIGNVVEMPPFTPANFSSVLVAQETRCFLTLRRGIKTSLRWRYRSSVCHTDFERIAPHCLADCHGLIRRGSSPPNGSNAQRLIYPSVSPLLHHPGRDQDQSSAFFSASSYRQRFDEVGASFPRSRLLKVQQPTPRSTWQQIGLRSATP